LATNDGDGEAEAEEGAELVAELCCESDAEENSLLGVLVIANETPFADSFELVFGDDCCWTEERSSGGTRSCLIDLEGGGVLLRLLLPSSFLWCFFFSFRLLLLCFGSFFSVGFESTEEGTDRGVEFKCTGGAEVDTASDSESSDVCR
jgi:hypothetical protein